jgi:hypothetical protein
MRVEFNSSDYIFCALEACGKSKHKLRAKLSLYNIWRIRYLHNWPLVTKVIGFTTFTREGPKITAIKPRWVDSISERLNRQLMGSIDLRVQKRLFTPPLQKLNPPKTEGETLLRTH